MVRGFLKGISPNVRFLYRVSIVQCLLAVVLQVLQQFLRQNLGGLGVVLGNLIDQLEQGLSPVLIGLGIGLDMTLG